MREIKYRIWNPGGDNMLNDVENVFECLMQQIIFDKSMPTRKFTAPYDHRSEGMVWMQFITKASNGDDVYEGDIVLLPADQLCKIEWRDTGFVAIAISPPDGYPREYIYWSAKEVVGNIYQNKELL